MNARFSWSRWLGILIKEFVQLKRDRLTFAMIVGIPLVQLMLFGFAINTDPKHLPTVVVNGDPSPFSRDLIGALQRSDYFKVVAGDLTQREADEWIARGDAQFVITIPAGFTRQLLRGDKPSLLLQADAADPVAAGAALSVLPQIGNKVLKPDLPGTLRRPDNALFEIRVHRRYNPEGITAYNIVPGLMGVILTMTMVLMTGLAMTRERERGTFENLLSTPALPVEVMTGKIIPYVMIGLLQVTLVLTASRFIFQVPMVGSLLQLYVAVLLFILANLTLGITISSVARNQLQAMQMTFFFFLPSMLLSGFMFPFRGMPAWAQAVGNVLPLTHFLVLVRGILLKGVDVTMLWPHVAAIIAFMTGVLALGLKTFRRTLD